MSIRKEVELPVTPRLPPDLLEKIGHTIVAFSYIEFLLSNITYDLMGIGQKEGRLVIKEPRASQRVEAIADLITLKGIDLSIDLKDLMQLIADLENSRNLLAHAVWMQHPNTHQLFIRVTNGTWQPDPKVKGKVKRIIKPEGREYGLIEVSTLCDHIDQATAVVLDLAREIVNKIPSLRKKYLLQTEDK